MSLATNFQNTATRLLSKFDERESGVDSIQLEQTPVIFNPVTGEDEPGIPVITDVIGVSVKFGREYTNGANTSGVNTKGNTIQAGDQLLKISNRIEPLMGDKILMDGLKYSIVSIFPSRYTNKTILYQVHIRR